MQRRLVPVIGVLTPGSPGVAPYTESGARFELEASQFEVLDHRPIEAILGEYVAAGATIDCFEPARSVLRRRPACVPPSSWGPISSSGPPPSSGCCTVSGSPRCRCSRARRRLRS